MAKVFDTSRSHNKALADTKGIIVDTDYLVELRSIAKDVKLDSRRMSRSVIDGGTRSSRRGRGMEFSEVRHYQPGDDIRNIDWRVTARTQETYTKLFQEEKERPVYLVVDQRSSMFFGSNLQFKSVLAAGLSSVIAWSAYNNRDKVGALIFGDNEQRDLRAKQGKFALFKFLHDLTDSNQSLLQDASQTLSEQGPIQPIADILHELQRVARPGSLIYILSDFHDFNNESLKTLSLLARHNEIELLHIYDPLETQLPKIGQLDLTDGDKRLTINSNSGQFNNAYKTQWENKLDTLKKAAFGLGIRLRSLSTHTSVLSHITDMFVKSNRRGAHTS